MDEEPDAKMCKIIHNTKVTAGETQGMRIDLVLLG